VISINLARMLAYFKAFSIINPSSGKEACCAYEHDISLKRIDALRFDSVSIITGGDYYEEDMEDSRNRDTFPFDNKL